MPSIVARRQPLDQIELTRQWISRDEEDPPIPHIGSDLFDTQSDDEEPLDSGPTVPEVLLEAVESVEASIVRLDDEQEQENGAEESDEDDNDDEDIPTAPMEESAATPKATPKAKRGAPAGRKRKAAAASDEPAAKRPGRGRATAAAASSAIKKDLSKRPRAPNGQAKAVRAASYQAPKRVLRFANDLRLKSNAPKKATGAKRGPKPKTVEPEEEFEVERIDDHKLKGKTTLYFVKWKGYPDEENTWEPESNLAHAAEIRTEYEASAEKTETAPTPKKAAAPKKIPEPKKATGQKQKPGPKPKKAAAKKTRAKPAGRGAAARSAGRPKRK